MATNNRFRTKGKGDDRKVFPVKDSKGVKPIEHFTERDEINNAMTKADEKEKVKMLETMARDGLKDLTNITNADMLLHQVKHWSGMIGQYSSYNTMLINMQNSKATLVRSAKDWAYFGRKIKEDEKQQGIMILYPRMTSFVGSDGMIHTRKNTYVPNGRIKKFIEDKRKEGLSDEHIMSLLDEKYPNRNKRFTTHSFGVGHVWDISQTTKIAGSKEIDNDMDIKASDLYESMKNVVRGKFGIDFAELDPSNGSRGYTTNEGKTIRVLRIPDQDVNALNTIIHELAHSQLEHHKRPEYHQDQSKRGEMEAEAELTAYIVSSYYGFGDKMKEIALPYIKGWLGTGAKFKEDNIDRVIKTAHKIVKATNETIVLDQAKVSPAEIGSGGA